MFWWVLSKFELVWPLMEHPIGRIVTQWPYCKQSNDLRGQTHLQPLLLRSEISLFWRTSCARVFFRCALYSVYCYTGVFGKYDEFARWGDDMEPKDTSGAKKPKLKKPWVTPLYLSRAVYFFLKLASTSENWDKVCVSWEILIMYKNY